MRPGYVSIVLFSLGLIAPAPGQAQTENNNSNLVAMRKARDSADVAALRKAIDAARQQAQQKNTASAYEQLALRSRSRTERRQAHQAGGGRRRGSS